MKYYDKIKDAFMQEQKYDAAGRPMFIEYSDAAVSALFDCDEFHYVGQDPITKLPKQMENTALKHDPDFWRMRREKKCFALINRGQLWYDTLTDSQKAELREWYAAWLNVTKTFVEPAMPAWLK